MSENSCAQDIVELLGCPCEIVSGGTPDDGSIMRWLNMVLWQGETCHSILHFIINQS